MPKKAKLTILIIVGVFIAALFLASLTWAIISITKVSNGYYVIGSKIAVLSDNNLMHGDRTGCFSKGDLVFFDSQPIDTVKQNDVILYKDGDGINVKRVKYILVKEKKVQIYAATDVAQHLDLALIDQSSILGKYSSTSTALGNLASFSSQFLGVLVLYIVPSILFFTYTVFLIIYFNKRPR